MLIGYVTLEDADTYVETHYIEDSTERTYWEDLDDDDKKALLLCSFEAIERLPFPGRKTSPGQPNAFPRYPGKDVPRDVKAAQIENALVNADVSASEEIKQYEKLWNAGVTSYRIGNLSETVGHASYGVAAASQSGVDSPKAKKLLIPFLSGGFNIE